MKLSDAKRKDWTQKSIKKLYEKREAELIDRINDFGNRFLISFSSGKSSHIRELGPEFIQNSSEGDEILVFGDSRFQERLTFTVKTPAPFPPYQTGSPEDDELRMTKKHPMWKEFIKLVNEKNALDAERKQDHDRIMGVLRGCNTVNQVKKNFPDLVDFIPEISREVRTGTELVIVPVDLIAKIKSAQAET